MSGGFQALLILVSFIAFFIGGFWLLGDTFKDVVTVIYCAFLIPFIYAAIRY